MNRPSSARVLVLLLAAGAIASVLDLTVAERKTIVIYGTPALRDFLEDDVIPRFEEAHGLRVSVIYVSAAEQYYRVRLSQEHPEADVFLHASPFFIEKGYADGHFEPFELARPPPNETHRSRLVAGGHVWYSFAWSPLVEVYSPNEARAPDLATANVRFGFPHPQLSNNGIYCVLFFERTSPSAGSRVLSRTVIQPVNARTNVAGVADHTYDVTLGYEAVVRFFQGQGANVAFDVPVIEGHRSTTPVLFSAGLVRGHPHAGAQALLDFLFEPDIQSRLAHHHLRPVQAGIRGPDGALPLENVERLDFGWANWADLERALPRYEVKG